MIIYILTSVCGIVGSVCNTIERYRKDPEDKTKWVVDEAAALVVKHIFKLCMEGRGQMQIAKLLQEEKVLNPTAYKKREGIKTPSPETADPLVASGTAPGASDMRFLPVTRTRKQVQNPIVANTSPDSYFP